MKTEYKEFIGSFQIDPSLCDDVINYYHSQENRIRPGSVKQEGFIDKETKESSDLTLSTEEQEVWPYLNALQECLNEYLKHFEMADSVAPFNVENSKFNIQRYPAGGGFKKWHFENSGYPIVRKRHLVFMTYLNDVQRGGTEFQYQNIEIQAVKGKTLIWPAIWTHTHRGVVSQDEIKYITTGWYSYVD